jgi:hypothetical protein
MTTLRKYITLILLILLGPISLIAQQDTVKYTTDFEFEDGFYFSFDQVKNNDPVPGARLITQFDHNKVDFYDNILKQKTIAFFDKNGARQEVPVSNLWGFSRNGVLYIYLSEGFHRVTIIGSICHFVANITTYDTRYYDPYYTGRYYNSPYYNPYYPYSPYNQRTTRNSEMKQYLIDFETGKVMDYDYKSVEFMLMKDPELHDEYSSLRKRKKKQLKFYYLRKFNERNPLYLPVEQQF